VIVRPKGTTGAPFLLARHHALLDRTDGNSAVLNSTT
jgi:hypothetical protein